MSGSIEVVEFTDPWCSWAWGTEPKLRLLHWRFGDRLAWRRVMVDLLPRPDRHETSSDPGQAEAAAAQAAAYWHVVSEHTGMPWPHELRWPPISSHMAGRSVTAALIQGDALAARLLRALRESLFVFCAPADTAERVLALAATVPGLDVERLAADIDSPAVDEKYVANRLEACQPNDYVMTLAETHLGNGNAKPAGEGRWRFATPTLIFRGPGGEATVPGWQPWARYEEAMEVAVPGSTAESRLRPSADEALLTWPLLTATELEFICGPGSPPPSRGEMIAVGGGHAWVAKRDVWPILD